MSVKKVKDDVTPALKRMAIELERLPREVYNYWVSITPKDKGNARRSTKLKGDTIHADYKYAERLDEGYSKQAPRGMIEPVEKYLERRLKQLMRK